MKYIKKFNESNDDEIKKLCEEYNIVNYTINDDRSIDVHGDVDISRKRLKKLPSIIFNKVSGDFSCHDNHLTSLIGCPKEVRGSFYCGDNNLETLEGCPSKVGLHFWCSYNRLTSLIGCPYVIYGSLNCHSNQLTSLIGCPKIIDMHFWCNNNKLTSLEGCPNKIVNGINFSNNQLTSLIGCPKEVLGDIKMSVNKLPKEIYDNEEYINGIFKYGEEYGIWKRDGSLDQFRFSEMMIDIKNEE